MSATPTTPNHLKFVSLEETQPQGARFRLVSYNILAQVHVKSSYFPHSPSACLKWMARSKAVLSVLKNLGADFLCLQEVDEYVSFYKENMESSGYSSIYIQRTGQKRGGCGVFFKHESAELILQEIIDYNDLVNSIQDGTRTIASNDIQKDEQKSENKDAKLKSGSIQKIPQDRGEPNDPCVRLKRD